MRAHLAGLGTAGSLVAGAALLFALASAFVAFRGLPPVGVEPAPASVVLSPPTLVTGRTAEGRRLAVLAARAPVARAPVVRARARGAAAGPAPAAGGARRGSGRVFVSAPIPPAGPAPMSRSGPSRSPASSCAGRCGAPALHVPVGQVTKTAAGAVQAASPGAAQAIQSAGELATGALSSAGSALPGH